MPSWPSVRWTERHGDWSPFKSKGAKQKDSSCVSIRDSGAYKFLLESPVLKIFSRCHNNRRPAILTLVAVPWGFPGYYHRLLGICVSLADFQIPVASLSEVQGLSSDLSVPWLCLAEHQEMSVNAWDLHPWSVLPNGLDSCFLLSTTANENSQVLLLVVA